MFWPLALEFLDNVYQPTCKEIVQSIYGKEEREISQKADIVTLECKTNAVAFWKSGKKKRHSLECVKHKLNLCITCIGMS